LLMFQAGCTGDLKGGSLGDPAKALEVEGKGVAFGWLSVLLLAAVAGTLPRLHITQRVVASLVALVVGLIAITVTGIQFEVWGVQSCFT